MYTLRSESAIPRGQIMACKQSVCIFHTRTFIYSVVIDVSPCYSMFCELKCTHNSHMYKHSISADSQMICKNKYAKRL